MFDNIRGVLHIRADGEKIYSFINELKSERIVCKGQKCKNNSFYCRIYESSFKTVEKIALKYNISVNIIKKYGLRYKFLRYRKRFGLFAGLILVPLFILFISNTVVIININGNEKNSREQIISALEDIGIKKGASISDIDFRYAEQKLRLSLDDVVWTAIRHTGCRITVDIDESDGSPEILKERTPANIIASRDAQIVSVNVLMGHLVKLVNDGVKKGDVIISGIYSDDKGNIRTVHSIGNITGIYNESVVFTQNFNCIERNPTGFSKQRNYFEMFGFRIPLFIKDELPPDYEYTENTSHFSLMKNELPFGIVKTEYIEYQDYDVVYSEEQAEKLLMDKIIRYENNFMNDIEILEKDIQKNIFDDHIDYIVNYRLKGEIGISEDVFTGKPD